MRKILILSTGGTIGQTKNEYGVSTFIDTDSSHGSVSSADTFQEFLVDLQKKLHIEKIDTKTILQKDSSNVGPGDWKLIVDAVVEDYDNYDGFLITHGTNTMGYTAAALSFAIGNLGKPVVLTGSQVPFGTEGTDATMNLQNSLRVLADETHSFSGVIVLFGSSIITGTRAKKRTEFDYDAFKTFGRQASLGVIGSNIHINDAELAKHNSYCGTRSMTRDGLNVKSDFERNIASITEFPGTDVALFQTLVDAGRKAFIIRSSGAGDPNIGAPTATFENLRNAFTMLRDRQIPVVVTTYAPDGVASMKVNECGSYALELGAIPAYDMSMEAMSTKLMWLLSQDLPYDYIRSQMVTSLRGEIDVSVA